MRAWTICFFVNLFVCLNVKSQLLIAIKPVSKTTIVYHSDKRNPVFSKLPETRSIPDNLNNTVVKTVPPGFYFHSIGFFCQKELQIEKALRLPLKFRLGSVAYTNEMEGTGKGNRYFSK